VSTNYYTPDGKHVGKVHNAGRNTMHFTWCTDHETGAGPTAASARAKVNRCKWVKGEGQKMTPAEFFENVVSKCSTFSESSRDFF